MSRTEVTVEQFRAFVKATGYRTDAEKEGEARNWRSPGFPLRPKQPAVFMTLNDAKAYCEFVHARVPSEAEWEYAARAGTTTHHYWGEEIDDRYLWYFNNTDQEPRPVAGKRPNAWGLYDMEGNAMEWVIAGGPYSWMRRDERDGRVSPRSSGTAGATSTSAAASELSITGVSEARDDERVLVELVVDRGCDHVQVESFVA
jgi:formylglycine-generating enzyme required for sulfatase activity